MAGPLRDFIDAASFGERLTLYTDTYLGRDPDEGTPDWDEDTTGTEVSGRIEQRDQSDQFETTTGEQITGQFFIYVPKNAAVQDGRGDEQERATEAVDESGNRYEVQLVRDQHNGTYRCLARLM